MATGERFWPTRLRWGLLGNWRWPAFAVFLVVDGFLLHALPPAGTDFPLAFGFIVASFGNLVLAGAVAPWVARRLAERRAVGGPSASGGSPTEPTARIVETPASSAPARPTQAAASAGTGSAAPPFEVLVDRTVIALLAAGALGLVAVGLASIHVLVSPTRASEENARIFTAFVMHHGAPEYRRNLDTADTIRLGPGYFRTCVANDDRRRPLCLFVDTNKHPPEVRVDPTHTPNQRFFGQGAER